MPTLKEWPESLAEQLLRPVERAVLTASMRDSGISPWLVGQIEFALCVSREYTAYGAYIALTAPNAPPRPTAPAGWLADTSESDLPNRSHDAGGGALVSWRKSPERTLGTVVFQNEAGLSLLELYPIDGEGWCVAECRELLRADLSEVRILPDVS